MPRTYEPIAYQSPASDVASVTFSDIPATYTDLRLVIRAKSNATGVHRILTLRFNSDSGSNYSVTRLYGNGSSAASDRFSSQTSIDAGFLPNTSSDLGTSLLDVMSYANTNVNKTVLCAWESHGGLSGSQYVAREVGLWRSTSAITSITLGMTDNIKSGSTFSLYGVKAA